MPTAINLVGTIITECTYTYSSGFFLEKEKDKRKARERELATYEGTYRGEEGTTSVTPACPEDR